MKSSNSPNNSTRDDSKKLHGLLIEDNALALKLIEIIANEAGINYYSSNNAEKALQIIRAISFDFIITDLGLPGISGYELAQTVRQIESTENRKPIPIFGLTASNLDEVRDRCLISGMDTVISKPINLTMMKNIISYVIDHS